MSFLNSENPIEKRSKLMSEARKERREELLQSWKLHETGNTIKIPDYLIPKIIS